MNNIILHEPFDAHLHLRQGDLLKQVVSLSAKTFSGALVMPNTNPPIFDYYEILAYKKEIIEATNNHNFTPFMTLYFNTNYTYHILEDIYNSIKAIKFYPKNLTTNSQHGCDPSDPKIDDVFKIMEDFEIPLCVHAEAPGYHEDREKLFHIYLRQWANLFPNLKIIIEHISDATTLNLLRNYENIYGTITAHHLLLTGDDVIGPPLNVHNFCMPVCKRPEDREALQNIVLQDNFIFEKLMFGSDSAPHEIDNKERNGCAGVFTAPICLQFLCELFFNDEQFTIDNQVKLNRLQQFVSGNAQKIYNLNLPKKEVNLVREPFTIPFFYNGIVPMWAGQKLQWKIAPSDKVPILI